MSRWSCISTHPWHTALLVFSAGLEVSQIIHEYCVPRGSSVLYAWVNPPVGFRKRHRPLERRGFWWPFPSAKPAREGQGSCVPRHAEAGDQGAWGEREARRAGVKASVSGTSGGLDRDVWTRLQAGGPTVKFETALSPGRQICLQAGSLFFMLCQVPTGKFKQRFALQGPVGPQPRGSCWASTQAVGECWRLSSAPKN